MDPDNEDQPQMGPHDMPRRLEDLPLADGAQGPPRRNRRARAAFFRQPGGRDAPQNAPPPRPPPRGRGPVRHRDDASTASSASSAAPPPPPPAVNRAPPLPNYPVRFAATPAQVALIREHYRREPVIVSNDPHTHGFIALGRAIAEAHVVRTSAGDSWTLDVGGNARRHASANRDRVHSACPVLSPRDAQRQMNYPPSGNEGFFWCQHMAEECNCHAYHSAIAVHSVYHLSARQIATIIDRTTTRRLWVVAHVFPNIAGEMIGGEAHYYRSAAHEISFSVTGEPGYQHPDVDWLLTGYLPVGDGTMIVAARRAYYGDHHVYECSVVTYVAPPHNFLTLKAALAARETVPTLSIPPITMPTVPGVTDASYETVTVDRVYAVADVLIAIGSRSVQLPLSRNIVHSLANDAAYMTRDVHTLKVMIDRARTMYRQRAPQLPQDVQTRASIVSAYLAMEQNVALEMSIMSRIHRYHSFMWGQLNLGLVGKYGAFDLGSLLRDGFFTIVGLGFGILGMKTRQFFARPAAAVGALAPIFHPQNVAFSLYAIFLAPPLEELVLHSGSQTRNTLLSFGLGVWELYNSIQQHGTSVGVLQAFWVPLHTALSFVPYPLAVAMHSATNVWGCLPLFHPALQHQVLEQGFNMFNRFLGLSTCAMFSTHGKMSVETFASTFLPNPAVASGSFPIELVPDLARSAFALFVLTHPNASVLMRHVWTSTVYPITTAVDYVKSFFIPPEDRVAGDKFAPSADPKEGVTRLFDKVFRPRRPILALVGIGFAGVAPSYYVATEDTELCAIRQRLLIHRDPTSAVLWGIAEDSYNALPIVEEFTSLGHLDFRGPVAFERWLAKYQSARRRQMLRDAHAAHGVGKLTPKLNMRSLFIKVEKRMAYFTHLFGLLGTSIKLGHPRSIISSSPERLCTLGPFFHAYGLRMQQVFGASSPILFGACNAETLGAWFDRQRSKFPDAQYLLSDTIRQDAHYSVPAIRVEERRYVRLGLDPVRLVALRQGHTFAAISRYGWLVRVSHRRASGDPQTAVGNTEMNNRVTNYALTRQLYSLTDDGDAAIATHGDDLLVVLERPVNLERFVSDSARLGFPVEARTTQNVWDVDFCSKLFYPSADGTIPAPKLGRMLVKFSWVLQKPTMHFPTVVRATLDDMWHVPFAREYLQCIIRLLPREPRKKVVFEDDYKMHVARRHEQSDEVWFFLHQRYGLTRADHDHWCRLLDSIVELPVVIDVPWVVRASITDE